MSEESIITPTPESPMPAAETTALDVLQRQVDSLTAQLQALTSERDEYRDALTEVAAERDDLKTAPEASARIAELEGTIRDRAHYDKFAELATASKAKAKALKSLWRDAQALAGYQVEGDEIDDKALQAVVAKLKTEVDYAFDPEPTANETAAREAARPTSRTKYGLEIGTATEPAGGGRANRNQGGDGTIVTQEMRADPKFMLDPKNKQLIGDAAREGRFR
jgi:hypothetical protein